MNPQSVYHAYAMSYLELQGARAGREPVPASVVARLAGSRPEILRAVMRALRDVEHGLPLRGKQQLLVTLERAAAQRVG